MFRYCLISLITVFCFSSLYIIGCKPYKPKSASTATSPSMPAGFSTSQLKGYWKDAAKGDWVKRFAEYENQPCIEVVSIKDIVLSDGDRFVMLKRVFYDDKAAVLQSFEPTIDLMDEEKAYAKILKLKEKIKDDKRYHRVIDFACRLGSMEIKGDLGVAAMGKVIVSEYGQIKGFKVNSAMVYFNSHGVKCGGKVFGESENRTNVYLLGQGTAEKADGKAVKPGDVKRVLSSIAVPLKITKHRDSEIQRVKNIWPTPVTKKHPAIADIKDPVLAASAEVRTKVDSLTSYLNGVKVGDWIKLLMRHDHIQVWSVYRIDTEKVYFRRRFFDNFGVLFEMGNATDSLAEAEDQMKYWREDVTYKITFKDVEYPLFEGKKKIKGKLFVRQFPGGRASVNIHSKSSRVLNGIMFNLRDTGEVLIAVLDFGRKDDSKRKIVKPGDVKKAIDWVMEIYTKHLPGMMPKEFIPK